MSKNQQKLSGIQNQIVAGSMLLGSLTILNYYFKVMPQILAARDPIFSQLIKSFSTEERLVILSKCVFSLGLFLFVITIFTMLCRVTLNKSTPLLGQEDPEIINVLNRIIQNTIEQGLVFTIFLSYYIFVQADNKTALYAYSLSTYFVFGRIIFAIGYIIGTKLNIAPLRALGFAINIQCQFLLIFEYFGLKIFGVYI